MIDGLYDIVCSSLLRVLTDFKSLFIPLCGVLLARKKGERLELWEGSGRLEQHKLHAVRAG